VERLLAYAEIDMCLRSCKKLVLGARMLASQVGMLRLYGMWIIAKD